MLVLFVGIVFMIGASTYNSGVQISPEATVVPTFLPEYALLPEEALLKTALSNATSHGLAQITSYTFAWMDLGTWWGSRGMSRTIADVNLPLFIVSFTGSGQWLGPGTFGRIEKISGVTIALDATSGRLVSASGAAKDLGAITGIRAEQVFIQDETLGQGGNLRKK